MKVKKTKKYPIGIHVDEATKRKIQAVAEEQSRPSMSNVVEAIVREYLERRDGVDSD